MARPNDTFRAARRNAKRSTVALEMKAARTRSRRRLLAWCLRWLDGEGANADPKGNATRGEAR